MRPRDGIFRCHGPPTLNLEGRRRSLENNMLKWMCAVAAAMALAAPAFAQKTDLPDRPAKQLNQFVHPMVAACKRGYQTPAQVMG